MTLSEMVARIFDEYGNRFQIGPSAILAHLDSVHQFAFSQDIPAFLVYAKITPLGSSKGPYVQPADCRMVRRIVSVIASGDPRKDVSRIEFTQDGSLFDKTSYFVAAPDVSRDYYFEYYKTPASITTLSDDAKVMVPPEWHDSVLVAGTIVLCDRENYGGTDSSAVLSKVMEPFWAAMNSRYRRR